MKITIENTSRVIELARQPFGAAIEARIWQGHTESGIPVQCYVALIAPEILEGDPSIDVLTKQFEEELRRVVIPRATVYAIPLRLII